VSPALRGVKVIPALDFHDEVTTQMLQKLLKATCLFLLSCAAAIAAGNHEGTEQLFGTWGNAIVNGTFGKDSPWVYYVDLSLRTTQSARPFPPSGQDYLLAGVVTHDAIGYRFNSHNAVHVGYAFQYAVSPLARVPTNENRAWEQYTYTSATPIGALQLRSRLEQRTVNIGSGTGVRFRQMVRLSYPLTDAWSVIGSDEIFVNVNSVDWGPVAGLDQNRVFVGVGYRFDPVFRTEIGYMNQYISRNLVYDRDFDLVSLNLYIDVPE
jgi:hypothetical protein